MRIFCAIVLFAVVSCTTVGPPLADVGSLRSESTKAALQVCNASLDLDGAEVLKWRSALGAKSSRGLVLLFAGSDSLFVNAMYVGEFAPGPSIVQWPSSNPKSISPTDFERIMQAASRVRTSTFKDPGVTHITCAFLITDQGSMVKIAAAALIDPARNEGEDPSRMSALVDEVTNLSLR